jgi:hypothetical protein
MIEENAKIFSKTLYEENDLLARNIFTNFAKRRGFTILDNQEDFKHDITIKKDERIINIEVEMKIDYPFTSKDTFPFPTVSFLHRKKKFSIDKPFVYVIISKKTNWAVYAESSDIYKDCYRKRVYVNTKHKKGEDLFFRVPKDICTFINLNE